MHLFHLDVDADGEVGWDEPAVDVLAGLDLDVVVPHLVDTHEGGQFVWGGFLGEPK